MQRYHDQEPGQRHHLEDAMNVLLDRLLTALGSPVMGGFANIGLIHRVRISLRLP
jgi:hypothetical protein